MIRYGLEEAVQMLIRRVVMLDERIVPIRQVRAYLRGIVPFQG